MRIVTSEPKHAKPLLDGDMRLHLAAQTGQGWATAQDECADDGVGCLVTIDSQAELDCLAPLNGTIFDQIWIGYRQGPNPTEPDGDWSWQCGATRSVRFHRVSLVMVNRVDWTCPVLPDRLPRLLLSIM